MANVNRIEWVDLARVAAILCVVLCHCVSAFYTFDLENLKVLSLSSKLFAFSSLTIGRLGVPLFLMISGYLLLDRIYDKQGTLKFWKKTNHLIVCTLFWSVLCELFAIFVLKSKVTLFSAILSILFLRPYDMNHLWYLPMIIGIYILIPFIANAIKDYDVETLIKPVIFFSVFVYLAPFVMEILIMNGFQHIFLQIWIAFSGGEYGLYLIIGYLIKKGYFKKYKSPYIFIVLLITLAVYVLLQIFILNQGFVLKNYYDSPFLFVAAVCIFELLSRIKNVKFYNIVKPMAIYAFAVFLIHNFVLKSMDDLIIKLGLNNHLKVIILFIIVIIISYILTIIISKIPKFGKYVLYLK